MECITKIKIKISLIGRIGGVLFSENKGQIKGE